MNHNCVAQQEFSKQAARFGDQGLTLSSQDLLDWIVTILPLQPEFRVLDVAAGTGHLSRAVAPRVREVVAIDLTREMLNHARREIVRGNFKNISVEEGSAERLPHSADSFDLVVSRLAIHHFEKPIIPLEEVDFQRWVQMTGTKPKSVGFIHGTLRKDINGDIQTGMRPFMDHGALKFLQVWSVMIGVNQK